MHTFVDQTIATMKTSAEATLSLHAQMGEATLTCARKGLDMVGKPFEASAFTAMLGTFVEAQKNALEAWGKAHAGLLPTAATPKKG